MSNRLTAKQRMPRARARGEGGFTLVEMSIVLALTSVVALTLGNVVVGTTSSMDYLMRDSHNVEKMQDLVNRIKDEIRDTGASNITIVTGTYSDTVSLKQARWNEYSSVMDYGVEDPNGYWMTGWQVRYSVSGTNLVRDLMPSAGVVSSSELVGTKLEIGTAGLKGFTVIKNGELYTVRIATKETFNDGKTCQKTLQSTVHLQN